MSLILLLIFLEVFPKLAIGQLRLTLHSYWFGKMTKQFVLLPRPPQVGGFFTRKLSAKQKVIINQKFKDMTWQNQLNSLSIDF